MDLRKYFAEVFNDHVSGSANVLKKFIDELNIYIRKYGIQNENQIINFLEFSAKELSHFPVVIHFIIYIQNFVQNLKEGNIEKSKDLNIHLINAIKDYKNKWDNIYNVNANKLIKKVDLHDKSILVHSNSSAIHKLFEIISTRKIPVSIFQTSSGPAYEGKFQSEKLASYGFTINYIYEAACSSFINQIDLAIFGADSISSNHFVNKSGTFQLCLLFNHFEKPVYVIADKRKVIESKTEIGEIIDCRKSPDELWQNPPKNVKPINRYFERIPIDLVKEFFI